MQLTTLTLLIGVVASVSATSLSRKDTEIKFSLIAKSRSPAIDGLPIKARDNKLWLSLPFGEQGADCDQSTPKSEIATLFIQNKELFLYGGEESSHKKLSVDFTKGGMFVLCSLEKKKPKTKRVVLTNHLDPLDRSTAPWARLRCLP